MNHREKILAQVAEGISSPWVKDEREEQARDAIADAIIDYACLISRDQIKALIAPFIDDPVVYDDETNTLHTTEEAYSQMDNTFSDERGRFAAKGGKVYKFAIHQGEDPLVAKLHNDMMDIAGRFVTAGEIQSINYLTGLQADQTICPVCSAYDTTYVYDERGAAIYHCNKCMKEFAVNEVHAMPEAEPVMTDLGHNVASKVQATPEGFVWEVLLGGQVVSEGIASGYVEACKHCEAWYETYIGIEAGTIYASANDGSNLEVISVEGEKIQGYSHTTKKPFTAKTAAFVDQLMDYTLFRSALNDRYADTAEVGTQYQGSDGSIVQVMAKQAGLISYGDSQAGGNMYQSGSWKTLDAQDFYRMIDNKGYVAI